MKFGSFGFCLVLMFTSSIATAQEESREPAAAAESAEVTKDSTEDSTEASAVGVPSAPAQSLPDEASSPEPVAEATPEPKLDPATQIDGSPHPSCSELYLMSVRKMPKAQQQAEFDLWWALDDGGYARTHTDEFELRKELPLRKAQFASRIAGGPDTYQIDTDVILGQYDFKKKGFPVRFFTDKKTGALARRDEKDIFHFGSGPQPYNPGYPVRANCNYGAQKLEPKKSVPVYTFFKISNLQKFAFFPVDEATAQKITSVLSKQRQIGLRFLLKDGSSTMTSYDKTKVLMVTAPATAAQMGQHFNFTYMKP